MNAPKPSANMFKKSSVTEVEEVETPRKRAYICVLVSGREVEVKAISSETAIEEAKKRFKEDVESVQRKPHVPQEHLMARPFAENHGLRDLQRKMNKGRRSA